MLQELVDLIGRDAVAKLIDIFGGTRLYIPHSPQDDDLLTGSLGPEAALKLARIYGGDRIEVPNPTPRRARILELRETGCSIDAIARNLGCTRRRVFQVLAEARASKRSALDKTGVA
jgi:Homeodomain-like domain